jgi:penicillin-binding protein 1C
LFFRAGAVLFALWIVFEVALRFVPLPAGLFATAPGALEVVDRHGRSLRTLRPAGGAFNRLVVYEQLPQSLIAATLAAEDKRFWKHAGVDWRASLRALAGLVKNRRVVSGGSTITQQLIKLTEPRPRTIRTKFIEALQAMRLEQIWDKQRILAEYFNRLDYGNLTTGPAEAAWQYFGKPLSDLSLAEAALLAGLPQSPGRLNPHTRLDRACKRQAWILSRLERNGQISAADRRRAGAEPLRLVDGRRVFEAPHFVDLLLQSVDPADATRAQSSIAAPGDGRSLVQQRSSHRSLRTVCTTLDLELNRFLERSIRHQLDELQGRNVHDGAAVVIDNKNSAVLALVGSGDYFAGRAGQVNGAWAPRSAGSTLKPFTYLLAFEQGANPATIVDDLLAEFATATGVFAPENYNRRCYGPMSYRRALANSLNISAVKVLQSVGGAAALQRRLQGFGLTTLTQTPEHYGLGLTIGNAEVRLLELANAYATLARLGEYRPWQLVSGENPPATAAVSTGSAWLIADILSDNNARALAFGLESPLRFDFPVACKTGTSSGFRDNWALGFTPEFTVGVWMGNFDGTPMREVSGVSGAAPVLHEMFERLHEQFGTTAFPTPANIVERTVHPLTGKILTGYEASGVQEKFLKNFLPPVETAADYDDTGRVRLPACYREWLAGAENWLGTAAVAENAGGLQQLRLVSPQPGTTFFIDADLPPSSRAIPLRAEGGSSLRWESESLECRAAAGGPVAVMREGRHRLTVMCSDTGERMETWVTVKLR